MYYPCSENKGADQLRGYREADLRLCFRIGKYPVFSRCGSHDVIYGGKNSGVTTLLSTDVSILTDIDAILKSGQNSSIVLCWIIFVTNHICNTFVTYMITFVTDKVCYKCVCPKWGLT